MNERYVRVYVMRPTEHGGSWAVRVDADKAERFSHERDAMTYALKQARAHHADGAHVELRIEDDNGNWRSMEL